MKYCTSFVSLFNIPGCFVRNVMVSSQEIVIEVYRRRKTARCPYCKRRTRRVHEHRKRKVLHDVIGVQRVYLVIAYRRFFCADCQRRFAEQLPFLLGKKRRTSNIAAAVISRLRKQSFRSTTETVGIGYHGLRDCLEGMIKPFLPNWTEEERKPFSLGIDEHYVKRNRYVLSVTNLTARKPIAFLPSDRMAVLKRFITAIPETIKKNIIEVCCDMHQGYINTIKEHLPKAAIIIDHFHLIQDANRRVNEARKIEQDVTKMRMNWKVFLKNQEHLRPDEQRLLTKYCDRLPILHAFYRVKEDLRDMYRLESKKEAEEKLKEIRKRMATTDIIELKLWARTLRRYEEYILNFFDRRTTNGYTEGIHVKCKLTQRISFGFRNIDVYIRKAMLAFLPLTILTNYPRF